MKTAMQELFDELERDGAYWPKDLRDKWLKKERQQIIDAYCANMGQVTQAIKDDAEQYYNETYNETNNSKA